MKEFTTNKGTDLYYEIFYRLGGYDSLADQKVERGYYLSVQRDPREIVVLRDITQECGSTVTLVRKDDHNSSEILAETLDKLNKNAETYLKEFLNKNYPEL